MKIFLMLVLLLMTFAVSAWADDAVVKQKISQAADLRIQALRSQMQSAAFFEQAIALEKEAFSQQKKGTKTRGSTDQLASIFDCICEQNSLDLCNRAILGIPAFSLTTDASTFNQKLEQSQDLRVQGIKAQMQSKKLVNQAIAIEKEVIDLRKKDSKTRGGASFQLCTYKCLSDRFSLYQCDMACENNFEPLSIN